jgi:hypothetical protein
MFSNTQNRRFADIAAEKGVDSEKIYEHDLAGASLKVLQLLGKSSSYDQVNSKIGKRRNPVFGEDLENRLPSDAKHKLLELFNEAIGRIDEVRKEVTRSFKINSEVIRLAIIEGLENSNGQSRLCAEIGNLSSDNFNQAVVFVEKTLRQELKSFE